MTLLLRTILTISLFSGLLWVTSVTSQISYEWVESRWDDSFVEWEFYETLDSTISVGNLSMVWLQNNDWSQWDITLGDNVGSIRTNIKQDFSDWTLRLGNNEIRIQRRWPDSWAEWRLSNGDQVAYVRSLFPMLNNEFICTIDSDNSFVLYTEFEEDYRTWIAEERGDVPVMFRVAATFISLFVGCPHY